MIKKIKNIVLALVLPLAFAAPAVLPLATASAACSEIAQSVQSGVDKATGSGQSCDTAGGLTDSSVGSIGKQIVTIFSEIVGVISIIMIIYGGFRYITSGGDSGNVGNAKNTIIYALIGLIIVALAQVIVHYVLNTTSTVVT
jgi:hypothetical protein